jgi:hypothetical protein
MALTKADLAAIADLMDARIAASVKSPRAKQATKAVKDTRTIAERREAAAGGECAEHDLKFATKGGRDYHFARTDITHQA